MQLAGLRDGSQLASVLGNSPAVSGFETGINNLAEWDAFVKSVQTAGDPNVLDSKGSLTGVPAIRLEALESTLRAITEREDTFNLWRRLKRRKTMSSVAEWSTKIGIGGDIGATFHGEYSDIRAARTAYKRDILRIKYMMTGAEITVAAKMQNTIEDLKAEENESATLRLLRDVEWSLYAGDESVVPEQFDGIFTTLERDYPAHVFDLDGSSDTEDLFAAVYEAFGRVRGPEGGFGKITDMYLSPSVQNDLDLHLHPQWRVNLDGDARSIEYGSPVRGVRTTHGNVALNVSVWIEDGEFQNLTAPVAVRRTTIPTDAPAAPTIALTPQLAAADTEGRSKFSTNRDGTYWYAVASINEKGEGPLTAIASAAVTVDGYVDVVITPNGSNDQTGYVIYRSTQDPAAAPAAADLRLVKRIPNSDPDDPSLDTTFSDFNEDLPGTSNQALLDLDERAIDWTQLLPLTQFPLYPTVKASQPWAVLLFGALKLAIPQRHWVVKNYVAKGARWKPHTPVTP